MNKFNFNKLTPFKWFVLENFPFLEADFDALTEVQLFYKLGKEINKIIDSQNIVGTQMENVTNAFIDLQNYVNNYFDNLDVQEEINNKLNELARNGTLYNIMKPYFTSIDLKIEQIENKVNTAVSGSPLVASSVSEMTDTTRVYVNTTDGNWYYYNGSNWTIGGTYQSTRIERNSIKPEDTTFVKRGNQLFNKNTITNGYYVTAVNGRLQPNSAYFASDFIPISSEETNIIISNPLNALQLAFYDNNKKYISGSTTVPVTIPSNAKYLRFSYFLTSLDKIMVNYGTTLLPYEDFHLIIDNLYVDTNKIFYVGANRDITSLKNGIEIATQYNNAILYVDEGIYNLVEEFTQEYLDKTTTEIGLILKNNIHVIFSPKSKVTFNYNGKNSNIHSNFSPFNSGSKGFTIENLTLECSNCRYGIHDERGNSTDRYKNIYKNCEISLDNSNNPHWSNPQNIGFGLGNDGEVEIENCVFNNWITFHLDNANKPTSQAIVTIKNNYFKTGAVWVDGNKDITVPSRFIVSNNSFAQGMHIGNLYDSIELFTFNNEIR